MQTFLLLGRTQNSLDVCIQALRHVGGLLWIDRVLDRCETSWRATVEHFAQQCLDCRSVALDAYEELPAAIVTAYWAEYKLEGCITAPRPVMR